MIYKTFGALEQQVREDMDLVDEPIVPSSLMKNFLNDGVQVAESTILTTCEDYFLTSAYLNWTKGQAEYDPPSDIFGLKIRGIVFNQTSDIYLINRLRAPNLFEKIAYIKQFGSAMRYQYTIKNASAAAGMKLVMHPTPRESGASLVEVHYIRSANRMEDENSVCDIPEFEEFIVAYAKWRCAAAEPGHPLLDDLRDEKDRQLALMVQTLSGMIADEDTEVPLDTSHYDEHI